MPPKKSIVIIDSDTMCEKFFEGISSLNLEKHLSARIVCPIVANNEIKIKATFKSRITMLSELC